MAEEGIEAMVESELSQYYAHVLGRPSIPPMVYFNALLLGYFEDTDSETGITLRITDSMELRSFLIHVLTESTLENGATWIST